VKGALIISDSVLKWFLLHTILYVILQVMVYVMAIVCLSVCHTNALCEFSFWMCEGKNFKNWSVFECAM